MQDGCKIEFTGKWARDPETFGVTFEAIVDGEQVRCRVQTEALQDLEPTMAMEEPEVQFRAHQHILEEIAAHLIRSGRVADGQLHIAGSDVRG